MIDHFEIKVKDLQISEGFYRSFLSPLDYKLAFKTSSLISFLSPNSPHPGGDFWLTQGTQDPVHFAFLAENKEEVQACYEAGLEAGGRDNGAPGYRSEHPIYYAAFMIDLDGNNIEVVCHKE
ncbi:VOC family protein [Streptococcus pneumoniae]|nr:VOC family protein [Streptococcus pneumoniae]VQJ05699.1 lactoylglutathione lyase [Streptococcus pneumoniae]